VSRVGAITRGSFGQIGILAAAMPVFTLVFANYVDAMGPW